ncbi:TetR/AcrR family transcriptional regulator [Pseudomonas sp. ICMP22404]|uniref:TetR/AcrR family transcriptional regulator n=1 Tax=Pseudomonas sp. ICMP22404 TaxID=2583807 RepID=UPI00111B0B73|nr:TetR/AcrR family transcriptional regulator [Pseudomonas sp. ICMP22404]TNF83457.1 TetR/AcrR family transcriptional regulator [Pseudomonas sp. ICMP22404]
MSTAEAYKGYDTIRAQALELFVNKGVGQVSMRELARHVGLAPGSLYNYFPSKQALLFDLIEEIYDELYLLVQPARQGAAKARSLSDLIVAHLRMHRRRPQSFRLALQGFVYLDDAQQQRIVHKRKLYESAFIAAVSNATFPANDTGSVALHAIIQFLNCLPDWLDDRQLDDEACMLLVEQLITGALRVCSEANSLRPDKSANTYVFS